MQNELTARAALLDENGALLRRGWARHMAFDYDARAVKASPFSLKEWDFYQISDDDTVLQLTIGHVSYMASVSATLLDLNTGERRVCSRMSPLPFLSLGMDRDPETPNTLEYRKNGFSMRFETGESSRSLSLRADDKNGGAEITVTLGNCSPQKEKTVIATPFAEPNRFYLNYKENCFVASGSARIGERCHQFGERAFGLLDWGRGVWPYRHEWIWANGSSLVCGRPFGFNIGWGFGDTLAATENMFFYDGRAVKLGSVLAEPAGAPGTLESCRFRDEDGLFDFTARPFFDNDTATRFLFVNNRCHQVFGRWSGRVKLDGAVLEIPEFTAFCEHAVNRW